MRIAFSGSHRVGKTTLVERVAQRVPGYATVDEPYYLLEEDGYELAEQPSLEDFEAQLARSLAALADDGRDVLFDRCPVDVLAYLLEHDDAAAFDPDDWMEEIRAAVRTLDLVVFVPIEDVDRVALAAHEDADHRRAVDDRLRELLLDEALGVEVEVLTVGGDVEARADQVVARMVGSVRIPDRSAREIVATERGEREKEPTMSVAENKELLRKAVGAFNKIDDRSGWFDFHADSVRSHGLGPATLDKGGMKSFYTALWSAFPDLTLSIDELIAEGDKVVWRVTASGTHKGPFQGLAPTGKSVKFGTHYTFRIEDGKIVERWETIDRLSLLVQLGALSLPFKK